MSRRSYQFSAEGPWRFPTRRPQPLTGLSSRDLLARIGLRIGMDMLIIGDTPHLTTLQQQLGDYGRLYKSEDGKQILGLKVFEEDEEDDIPAVFDRIVVFDLQQAHSRGVNDFGRLRQQLKSTGRLILLSPPHQPPIQRSPWIRQAQKHGLIPCMRFGATWNDTLLFQPQLTATSLRNS